MKIVLKSIDDILGFAPLTVFIAVDEAAVPAEFKEVDALLEGRLKRLMKSDDFKTAPYAKELLYANPKIEEPRVVVVGLGKGAQSTSRETWEHAVASATMYWQNRKVNRFAVLVPQTIKRVLKAEAGLFLAKGVWLGSYDFNNYKSDKKAHAPAVTEVLVTNVDVKEARSWNKMINEGAVIGEAINMARQFGDLPPIEMTPTYLARHAETLAKTYKGLKVKVLNKDEIKKLGMGAFLGVNAGATEPPKFIILEWMKARKKNVQPVVLVGKGITFDSGGISIKPSDKMDEMKFDMMGGAAVIGALRTIAALDLPVNVVGLVPATENLPSGSAYRPGDILRGMGGKTIEVLNTDAEGRVILSDALEYAKRYKPALVVDVATLTGACIHAVGEEYAGLFTRDAKIKKCIEDAAEMTNEPVWQLPLDDSHVHSIKSYVADVKNIGERKPGASTAAAFLEFFTDYPWAHLDIAGQMAYGKPQPFQRQGARGFGVHLLTQVVRNWFKV